MSADKTSVERNGAICYNIFKFKKTWQGFPLIHVGEELPQL